MRLLALITVIGVTLICIAAIRADSPPTSAEPKDSVTLLGTLEAWKYPDSKMPHGASMSDGGNPTVQSVKCQTILTTPDSFKKVVGFYIKKLGISAETGDTAKGGEAQTVLVQDDSDERPVSMQVITVHRGKASTTLVISRAEHEKETHIAWSHYIRLGDVHEGK